MNRHIYRLVRTYIADGSMELTVASVLERQVSGIGIYIHTERCIYGHQHLNSRPALLFWTAAAASYCQVSARSHCDLLCYTTRNNSALAMSFKVDRVEELVEPAHLNRKWRLFLVLIMKRRYSSSAAAAAAAAAAAVTAMVRHSGLHSL